MNPCKGDCAQAVAAGARIASKTTSRNTAELCLGHSASSGPPKLVFSAVERPFLGCHVARVSVPTSSVLGAPRRVALFVTCLVDLFRPSVGFAAIKLLEDAGCTVEVPPLQVCCGQPAYNSGDRVTAQAIARQVIDAFEGFEAVVVPSVEPGV